MKDCMIIARRLSPIIVVALLLTIVALALIARGHHTEDDGVPPAKYEELSVLPPDERRDIELNIGLIGSSTADETVQVGVILVTATDVWVGMESEGLFRYDRIANRWHPYEESKIGKHIHCIWQEGSKIWVEHCAWGNHTYCYVDFTDDRGKTWTRFLIGDACGDYVHAPQFTNSGLRTERLQKITTALRQGIFPEELVERVRIDNEVYFTIYVNSSEGWCAFYRYDLAGDRLTDLAISELDPHSVGVRAFHLDPYEERFIWILSGRYGGAIQTPHHWFRYDRRLCVIRDTGISYDGADDYLDSPAHGKPYLDLIRFDRDHVFFLGFLPNGSLGPIATYDRRMGRLSFFGPSPE